MTIPFALRRPSGLRWNLLASVAGNTVFDHGLEENLFFLVVMMIIGKSLEEVGEPHQFSAIVEAQTRDRNCPMLERSEDAGDDSVFRDQLC